MDSGSVGGQVAKWGAIIAVVLTLIGGTVSVVTRVNQIDAALDRNCRILTTLDQDIRLHAISEGPRPHSPHDVPSTTFAPFPKVSC
jgi:hypothetical protein